MSKLPRLDQGGKPQMKTTTSRDPRTGALRTTTRSNVTELRPSGSASQSSCQPCDTGSSGISRLPAPRATPTMLPRPPQGGIPRPPSTIPRAGPTRPAAPSTSRNFVPCPQRGPDLRQRMESKLPPPVSGQRGAYGYGGRAQDERPSQDTSISNKAADATELLNLSSPNVTAVEQHVEQDLMEMYATKNRKVYAKGKDIQKVPEEFIQTPAGMEPVIHQAYSEKRVERDGDQERVVKNISVSQLGTRVTISEQQIDPDFGIPGGHGRDVVTIKETIAVTPKYKATAKDTIHESAKGKAVRIDPEELANLVEEENEDVENTLKMAPPDLTLNPEKYTMKKRLQKLRLNSESVVLLEQAVVNPASTADDALMETPPEALVHIMHTVEAGVTPQCPPDQVFNTLFEEKGPQHSVNLSSVGPGPLQDVVVPQEITKDVHKEAMTADLNKLTEKMKNAPNVEEIPYIDIFTRLMNEDDKKTTKKVPGTQKSFKPIGEEEMPWGNEDIEPMVNIIGAEPVEILDPINIEDLEQSGKLQEELANGIEYFVEADPVQYMSRVQLRGSQPPSWFPGFIYALPEFQDIVKVARSPDEVFYASWKAVQPRIIPEDSISIRP